jgi:serine phosphatase RsbU (regulator of sigma subunit)
VGIVGRRMLRPTRADLIGVVLIEDDTGDALLAEEFLAEAGEFDVRWGRSLKEGLGLIGPDTHCVLLDLGLPDVSGVQALKAVEVAAGRIPVVVLTGWGDRAAGDEAVASGAQDYLVKGEITPASLARSVRYAIERAGNEERDRHLLEAGLRREENLRMARSLHPDIRVADPSVGCETRYLPAGQGSLLGGDFLDGVELSDGTVRLVIGDVAGHGPEQAAVGVALRAAWRALVLNGADTGAVLPALDRLLLAERSMPFMFTTVCEVTIEPDRRHLRLRSAGHPPPLLDCGLGLRPLPVRAEPPLGAGLAVPGSGGVRLDLPETWQVLLYTDGIYEGRAPDGSRRTLDHFAQDARCDPGQPRLVDRLVARAEAAHGGPLPDDVALVHCWRLAR